MLKHAVDRAERRRCLLRRAIGPQIIQDAVARQGAPACECEILEQTLDDRALPRIIRDGNATAGDTKGAEEPD